MEGLARSNSNRDSATSEVMSLEGLDLDHFIRRMQYYVSISDADLNAFKQLPFSLERYAPGQTIVALNEPVEKLYISLQGWCLRERYLDDGRRQIINFHLPGDYFDLMSLTGARSDHSFVAATNVTLRVFDGRDFLKTVQNNPKLASAFWWVTVQEETILRQQIVRVGRLSARERISNFVLELNRRQTISSGSHTDYVPLPVPQAYLADALGLSIVHVSRSLTALKSSGLLRTSRKGIEITNRAELMNLAEYNPALFDPAPVKLAAQ